MKTNYKRLLTLFAIGSFMWPNKSDAQIYGYTYADEQRICVEDSIPIYIYGGFYDDASLGIDFNPGDLLTVDIDFGDGQTDTQVFTLGNEAYPGVIEFAEHIKHKYASVSTYVVNVTFMSNGQSATSSTTISSLLYSGCEKFSGQAYFDYDDDCVRDLNETSVPNQIMVNQGGTSFVIATEANGNYEVYLPTSLNGFEVSPQTNWSSVSVNCPVAGSYTFNGSDLPLLNQDFSVKSNLEILAVYFGSGGTICQPENVCFYLYGDADGYADQNIELLVNFGDGFIDTLSVIANSQDSGLHVQFCHFFATPGNYNIQVIANGAYDTDTFVTPNAIVYSDSCGDITGTVFIDANSNCTQDGGEFTVPGAYVTLLESGVAIQYDFADANGIYSFEDVPVTGNYSIQLENIYAWLDVSCPSTSGLQTVPSVPASGLDFAFDGSLATGFDLLPYANVGTGFNRPGQSRWLTACVENQGLTPVTGELVLELDPLLEVGSIIPAPSSISGNTTITWDFASLVTTNPYYWYGDGAVCFNVYITTDTTANIGDTLCLTLTASPSVGDEDPANNTISICAPVLNSYDPNDKSVTPRGDGAYGFVQNNQTMTYTVRFQNTGNAEALNIFVKDTIDANLDLSTLKPLISSHDMSVQVNGRVVTFVFNGINLPDSASNEAASHGFIVYGIDQVANLNPGDEFENTAHIYFDYNAPIVTNTVVNTIASPATSVHDVTRIEANWSVYPNPVRSVLTLEFSSDAYKLIELKDVLGKVVMLDNTSMLRTNLNVSSLSAGIYSLTVTENGISSTQKVVVDRK